MTMNIRFCKRGKKDNFPRLPFSGVASKSKSVFLLKRLQNAILKISWRPQLNLCPWNPCTFSQVLFESHIKFQMHMIIFSELLTYSLFSFIYFSDAYANFCLISGTYYYVIGVRGDSQKKTDLYAPHYIYLKKIFQNNQEFAVLIKHIQLNALNI